MDLNEVVYTLVVFGVGGVVGWLGCKWAMLVEIDRIRANAKATD